MGEGVHTIQSAPKTDRSWIRDTDNGLNRQEAYTVSRLENQIRNRHTEKAYYIGNDGQVIAESYTRARRYAQFRPIDSLRARNKDAVLIHNHPQDFNDIAGRIGNPFSSNDILTAAQLNLKEVRAITPNYTYSIRRPKNGWPDERTLRRALTMNDRQWKREARDYMAVHRSRGVLSADERQGRANVGFQNAGMKRLAKMFGWEFTRRKSK